MRGGINSCYICQHLALKMKMFSLNYSFGANYEKGIQKSNPKKNR